MATVKNKTITFIADASVVDHNKNIEFEARCGDVRSLHPASADRWIRRGMAVEGERVKNESEAEELRIVTDELARAKERMNKASADESNPKEIELATKFLERKQKAFDDIVGTETSAAA